MQHGRATLSLRSLCHSPRAPNEKAQAFHDAGRTRTEQARPPDHEVVEHDDGPALPAPSDLISRELSGTGDSARCQLTR